MYSEANICIPLSLFSIVHMYMQFVEQIVDCVIIVIKQKETMDLIGNQWEGHKGT